MLPYVKFAEDKVLVFVILRENVKIVQLLLSEMNMMMMIMIVACADWNDYFAAVCLQISFVGDDVHAVGRLVLLDLHHSPGDRLLRPVSQLPPGRPNSDRPRGPRRRPRLEPLHRLSERADGGRGDWTVALRL